MKTLRWNNEKSMMIPLSDIFFGIVKYLVVMIHTLSTCLGDENKEVYNSVYERSSVIYKCFISLFPLTSNVENKTNNFSLFYCSCLPPTLVLALCVSEGVCVCVCNGWNI